MELEINKPTLLARTGPAYSHTLASRTDGIETEGSNFFKSIRWRVSHFLNFSSPLLSQENSATSNTNNFLRSPDGTCLITNSADNSLRTFIAPSDLLSPRSSPVTLAAYSSLPSPEPIYALTPYPFFSLQEQQTTLLLSSPRDLPIRLSNALYPSILATYRLTSPTTEAFLTPSSIVWTLDGTHFLTGTECLIALFDISRTGSGPTTRLPTIPSKRHKMKGGGIGMRGIVSSLSIQPSSSPSSMTSLLAAGTWTRWVSLYDVEGLGGTVANWSIASAADNSAQISGTGVSQTLWSSCGRYLFVVERKSRGILIYDVRVTGRLVGWLHGRIAETNQRLEADIFPGAEGEGASEVWAGGTDGWVRVWKWKGIGEELGVEGIQPAWKWGAHEAAVTGMAVHPSGTVVATSSGQRQEIADFGVEESRGESDSDSDVEKVSESSRTSTPSSKPMGYPLDNSIKIWSL